MIEESCPEANGVIVAVPVARVPPVGGAEKVTVGGEEYPVPPDVTLTLTMEPSGPQSGP